MRDVEHLTYRVLTFMAKGGLRRSLFVDTPEDDAQMMLDNVAPMKEVPKSQKPTVVKAITAWRETHGWLAFMPDALPEDKAEERLQ